MDLFVTILHILTSIALVAIVLLQHGKGADMGATFGGGASQTVFGSRGAGNFLTKLTAGAAILFMVTSLTLSYWGTSQIGSSLIDADLPREPIAIPEVEPESTFPEARPIPEPGEGEVPSGFEEIAPPERPPAGEG